MMKNKNLIFFWIYSILLFNYIYSQNAAIIADHTVVDEYIQIPQKWIDSVKTKWFNLPGESHSKGYRIGAQLLEDLDSTYSVLITESGTPPSDLGQGLRVNRATWGDFSHSSGWCWGYGEEDWFTNATAISRTKAHLDYTHNNDLEIFVIGFGWCWDMSGIVGGTVDPVFNVRWAGVSKEGPQGSRIWGLDIGDSVLTGNSVNMNTYLSATEEYKNYCLNNNYNTTVLFTTGPVDGNCEDGERGYQRYIKHEYIRNYVANSGSGYYLFDYADILSWNNLNSKQEVTWNNNIFQAIHPDNMYDYDPDWNLISHTEDGDHIGEVGALRLAKAMWWMLARIAGWSGSNENIPPVALDDSTNTNENVPITIDVLANDSDPDGNLVLSSVEVANIPDNGITEVDTISGNIIYTPNSGYAGIDTFGYTVNDDSGAISNIANVTISVHEINIIDDKVINTPDDYCLYQNYPNPFNPTTIIQYILPQSGEVIIDILDIRGRVVKNLLDEYKTIGYHRIEFKVGDLSSGVYFYKLKVGEKYQKIRKMMVVK